MLSLLWSFAPGFQFVAVDQKSNDSEDNAQGSNTDNDADYNHDCIIGNFACNKQLYRFVIITRPNK